MVVKQVFDLSLRDSGKRFLSSLRASSRYCDGYLAMAALHAEERVAGWRWLPGWFARRGTGLAGLAGRRHRLATSLSFTSKIISRTSETGPGCSENARTSLPRSCPRATSTPSIPPDVPKEAHHSSAATQNVQYAVSRRFNWLVEREYVDASPPNLPHQTSTGWWSRIRGRKPS